eukprot:TRINITY_DN112054_c0_g1_i1.p1 TRINITY_DN112054_c0_g1~~TRINITY_DN112054_c0_g1_i1.p1  ORF type:complete len:504 (-),score=110.14 TRINITY_DN112054_c0_g1_i1:310-1821(-)
MSADGSWQDEACPSGCRQLFFDAGDLGLSTDSAAYQGLVAELGQEAPWPEDKLHALFDSRFPGWDELPSLSLSSPLSRLRGLVDVFRGGDAAEEALRALVDGHHSAGVRLRLLCNQESSLQDECGFLLQVLESVAGSLLKERERHAKNVRELESEAADARAKARVATQEAAAQAQAESKKLLADLAAEADTQQLRADAFERDLAYSRVQLEGAVELEASLEQLGREHERLKKAHEELLEDLREARSQKASLVVAHEESECAVAHLKRCLKQHEDLQQRQAEDAGQQSFTDVVHGGALEVTVSSYSQATTRHCSEGGVQPNGAFLHGARSALALAERSEFSFSSLQLRAAVLAWRCAIGDAKHSRLELSIGAADTEKRAAYKAAEVAAEDNSSLQAKLVELSSALQNGRCDGANCCCHRTRSDSMDRAEAVCCRQAYLEKLLEELKMAYENAMLWQRAFDDASASHAAPGKWERWARYARFALISVPCLFTLVLPSVESFVEGS